MSQPADPFHPAKFYGLDHLRAFAITFVLVFHYQMFGHPHWIETVGKFGWTGVDLFFVLSGFLISTELFKELSKTQTLSLKNFFIKRSFRILPAYLLVVGVYFLIPAYHEREALPPLWRFLTFTQNFGLDLGKTGTFSHAWSLCVEEQFYLLLPLALLVIFRTRVSKNGIYILGGLVVLGFIIRLLIWHRLVLPYADTDDFVIHWYKHIYYPIYNRLDGLLTGIAIAALFHFKPLLAARIAKHGNLFLPAGLLILACAYILCIDAHSFYATIFGFPLIALGYGLVVICAICPGSIMHRYSSLITAKLAGLSYGIYLTHKGIIHLVQKYAGGMGVPANSNQMLLLCLLFVLLGALLLQYTIEKPFLKLRKHILKQGGFNKNTSAQTHQRF
ncbi:MAG: acyltransferase [Bacteroidota bacterium]